jgi:hypothetical protein
VPQLRSFDVAGQDFVLEDRRQRLDRPPVGAEPFEPSQADWEDYARWAAMVDSTRDWYERHDLAEFNASL